MSKLAVLSLKNRALIALVTIVAALFGSLALTNLKQELIPSIEFPALIVVTTYPGASPEVVANDDRNAGVVSALHASRVVFQCMFQFRNQWREPGCFAAQVSADQT